MSQIKINYQKIVHGEIFVDAEVKVKVTEILILVFLD